MIELQNFSKDEFKCRCGCGFDAKDSFKLRLQMARAYSSIPYRMSSAARCETHNRNEQGSETSTHLLGLAADIMYRDEVEMLTIIYGLVKAGFVRIGINIKLGFIHVDEDPNKPKAFFKY